MCITYTLDSLQSKVFFVNIWKRKNQIFVLSCKMAFNKSHIGMCRVNRGHFITTKLFGGGEGASWGKSKGTGAAAHG